MSRNTRMRTETNAETVKRLSICLACSHGGHLTEMLSLAEAFEGHDAFYFCYDADTTRALPRAHLVPNRPRNPLAFVANLFRLARIFRKERPDLVVSTGAEIAIPVVLVAKLFRVPSVYIECGAQVTRPSWTGRLMYWLADRFYVQWRELLRVYGPRARMRGSLIDEDEPIGGDRSRERRLKATLVQSAYAGGFSSDQPPMGLAYIASALEGHGCEVRVIDANAERLSAQDVTALIAGQAPDLVCFTVTTPLLPGTLGIVKGIRALGQPPMLIAGGPHATVLPEELLAEGAFDYVVRSEGEVTLGELVERLAQGQDAEGVAGVSWRKNGRIVHNPERPLCAELDALPCPDWSLFPLGRYSSLARRNDFCLPIITSRGCPYGCTFCYKGVFGRRLRLRPAADVVDEWQFLVERYGAREIAVIDDVFTADAERVQAICAMLTERGLARIPWSTTNGLRVNHVTPELLQAMKAAGCYRVYFGAESGVQRVIDSLNKNITIEQVRAAVRAAHEAGLEVGVYFMLGNLGETLADTEATMRFCRELDPDYAQYTVATPYPGTALYDEVVTSGRLRIDAWDDLASYGSMAFDSGELTSRVVARQYRKALRKFYCRPRFLMRQLPGLTTWTGFKHRLLGLGLVATFIVPGWSRRAGRRRGERTA